MKKSVLLCLFCVAALLAGAQSINRLEIDYKSIEEAVTSNPGNYDSLLQRFIRADTTLTDQECAVVYYGFSFREGYMPLIIDSEMMTAVKEGDYEKTIAEATRILDENPVYLRANYLMGLAMNNTKNPEWEKYVWRFSAICRAILGSGDGQSAETAFKVICIADEYEILQKIFRIRGLQKQAAVATPPCDAMTVIPANGQGEATIYFNVERSRATLNKLLK